MDFGKKKEEGVEEWKKEVERRLTGNLVQSPQSMLAKLYAGVPA